MAYRGIDVREGSDRLIFRASLKDSDGARVVSGTTNLRLGKLHSDGTLLSYDFDDNTFKAGALTTAVVAMTHQTLNNATVNTGLWTYALTTLTGFTAGDVIVAIVENSGALPAEQEREFQFGSGVLSDITYINGDAQSVTDLKDLADTGYNPSKYISPSTGAEGCESATFILPINLLNFVMLFTIITLFFKTCKS